MQASPTRRTRAGVRFAVQTQDLSAHGARRERRANRRVAAAVAAGRGVGTGLANLGLNTDRCATVAPEFGASIDFPLRAFPQCMPPGAALRITLQPSRPVSSRTTNSPLDLERPHPASLTSKSRFGLAPDSAGRAQLTLAKCRNGQERVRNRALGPWPKSMAASSPIGSSPPTSIRERFAARGSRGRAQTSQITAALPRRQSLTTCRRLRAPRRCAVWSNLLKLCTFECLTEHLESNGNGRSPWPPPTNKPT